MAERGRPEIAYPSLMQALLLNPNNSSARQKLAQVKPQLNGQESLGQPPLVRLDYYPSSAPRTLLQGYRDAGGGFIPHAIAAVFYENGRLKQMTDYADGLKHGTENLWDSEGKIISSFFYRMGAPVQKGGVILQQ
jgi:antitoxin component YwqK of YwqJK toxin-antitoxin module